MNAAPGAATGANPAEITTQPQFGAALTELRELAGLSVREAARKAGLATATAGGYFAGTHLPALKLMDTEFIALLSALGVSDEAEVRSWCDAVRRVRRRARRRSADQRSPYRGLAPFEPEDAVWFFGRAELTALVHERAAARRREGAPLFVVGPSGSGKSSVLRAGLIPLLRAEGGAALITPGRSPLAALERVLGGAERPEWIVVDQFEELFTHNIAPAERAAFLRSLIAAAASCGIVVGMRADFYAAALAEPELAASLQDGQVVVGAMDREQLRAAIFGPAAMAGASVEPGLVELLIEQSIELGRERAGTLPLLSHALLAAWAGHEGQTLTSADYLATGGIANAVARTAEEAFHELDSVQQDTARLVFLHLVHIAEGSADTARKVSLDQLPGLAAADGGDLPEAIAVFIDRRLLTAGAGTLQIAHEALLTSWPRLRSWLDADRAALLAQRRVAFAAEGWRDAGRDPAALLRGAPLAAAESLAGVPDSAWQTTALEREFLAASVTQRSLEHSARARTARRLRVLAGALALLLLVATGTAAYGFDQRSDAQSATRLADSRAVAEAGDSIRGLDPTAAAQLSLAAYRIAPTVQSRSALLDSTDAPEGSRVVDGAKVVQAIAVAAQRNLAAVADADGTLVLWNITDPGDPTRIGAPLLALPDRQLFAVAVSPDGHLVAASGSEDSVSVWNIADPARPVVLPTLNGPTDTVYALAFNPAGTLLAAASADGSVRLWRIGNGAFTRLGALPLPPPVPASASGTPYLQSIAFSPDGKTLAAGTSDGRVVLWNVSSPGTAPTVETGLGSAVLALAFSPDGRLLATGTRGMQLQFWSVTGIAAVQPSGAALNAGTSWVNALAFSPDGRQLATGTGAKNVQLWDVATRTVSTVLPHPEPVASVAWAGAHTLISGCADGVLRLWSLPAPALPATGVVNGMAFSPDSRVLAIASGELQLWDVHTRTALGPAFGPSGEAADSVAFSPTAPLLAAGFADGTLRVWNVANPTDPVPLGSVQALKGAGAVESLAFNGTGTVIATGDDDETVRLWAVHTASAPTPGTVLPGFNAQVFSVAFRPHSEVLAAGSIDGTVRLWQVNGPDDARLLGHPLTGFPTYVYSVAFSPSGSTLAVGIANGTVQLWNVSDPGRPTSDGPPLTGPLGYTYALAFSPDGTTLAGAETDDSLWQWNVADPTAPTVQATLSGATDSLYAVAFSPDGATLAAGGADSSVRLWQPQPAAAAASLCADLGQALSPTEWARDAPGLPITASCA